MVRAMFRNDDFRQSVVSSFEDTKDLSELFVPGKRVEEFQNYLGRKVLEMGDEAEGK